jgi:hypothetical protein
MNINDAPNKGKQERINNNKLKQSNFERNTKKIVGLFCPG